MDVSRFKDLVAQFIGRDPAQVGEEEIRNHLHDMVVRNNYSDRAQNQIINATKLYYEQVLGQQQKQYWIEKISTSVALKPSAMWFYSAAVGYQTRFNFV